MNYIMDIQKAIDYIEKNLEEDINYEKIAKQIGMSPYYFHRVFSSIVGVSPTEYIRNRRLTLGAEELTKNENTILDIAIKYGFDSNESFTRAFKKFHGILPKMAKQKGNELKAFSKVNFQLKIDAGNVLNYRIEDKEEFKICAIIKKFSIESKNKISQFWDEVKSNGKLKEISKDFTKCTLGICIGENSTKEYKYGIGIEYIEKDLQISGTEIIDVAKSKWIVFKCKGQKAEDINALWARIYKEYFITSKYKQSMNIDFELYDKENTEIWIPIGK